MKAFELGEQSGLHSLRLVERPTPEPGLGQALIRVRACGLNNRDLRIASGRYGERKPAQRIPLSDGAGDVVALGPGVDQVCVGDRVTAAHLTQWLEGEHPPAGPLHDLGQSVDGWLAEYVCLPAAALVKLPDTISYEAAAVCPAAGLAAWNALRVLSKVSLGDRVLTLGTGGVAIWALQIANMFGASVLITSSSEHKLDIARSLGANHCVNYLSHPAWEQEVMAATGQIGVNVVVETIGLSTLDQSIASCAPMARIALVGGLGSQVATRPSLTGMMGKNLLMQGITGGSRRMLQDLILSMHLSGMRPLVHRGFDFEAAAEAYACLQAAQHVGKVIVRVA